MDKINVLWVEDNPLQEAMYVSDLIKRAEKPEKENLEKIFSKDLYEFPIPAIHFTEKELGEYHKYFNLQVLQHPVEVKDYISMCLQLEDAEGKGAFSKMEVVLPEIIPFDYLLSERISINQGGGAISYNPKIQALRKFINPNFKFKEKFEKLFKEKQFLLEKTDSRNYSQNDFLKAISKLKSGDEIKKKDKDDLSEDDFGLFAAVEILRIFREHPVVAMPATFNKNEAEKLSLHGKYFEWLNEYDYSVDFERAERGNKKWDAILKDAVRALQKKIETHSKLGKITLDLNEILKLATENISKKENERVLTIRTAYGKKRLPLDGLFINIGRPERDKAIKNWAVNIFDEMFKSGMVRTDLDIINNAKKYADTLWGAYQDKRFWDRVNFSKLHKMTVEDAYLSKGDKKKYDQYLKGKVSGFKVKTTKRGGGSYEYLNPVELKGLIKKVETKYNQQDNLIISWTVLFVMIKIFKARMDYLKKNGIRDNTLPTENEILTVLFPLASNPVIMPIHGPNDNTAKEFIVKHFNLKRITKETFENFIYADEKFYGEPIKYLLRWYAESMELTDDDYLPTWLK